MSKNVLKFQHLILEYGKNLKLTLIKFRENRKKSFLRNGLITDFGNCCSSFSLEKGHFLQKFQCDII